MQDHNSAGFTCYCTNCTKINFEKVKLQELTNDAIADLEEINDQLYLDINNWEDPELRQTKLRKLLVKLEAIDNSILYIYNMLNNTLANGKIESNFGMCLKLDDQMKALNAERSLHEKLRKEWYCQEDHLNKTLDKVRKKDMALRYQSIYCASQGLVLGKMLWKLSNSSNNLDVILEKEVLGIEILQTFKHCLEALINSYSTTTPDPDSNEYQYVVCLAGILSNVTATPDGRFFVINRALGRTIYDDMIKSLPNLPVPESETLKWIILSIIHNMMICKEGENYARENPKLLRNLAQCLSQPHSNRIMILVLKMLSELTDNVSDELYKYHIVRSLPVKKFKKLQDNTDSLTVNKYASCVIGSLTKIKHFDNETLIRTAKLDGNKSNFRIEPFRRNDMPSCFVVNTPQIPRSRRLSCSSSDEQLNSARSSSPSSSDTLIYKKKFVNKVPLTDVDRMFGRDSECRSRNNRRDETEAFMEVFQTSKLQKSSDSLFVISPIMSHSEPFKFIQCDQNKWKRKYSRYRSSN